MTLLELRDVRELARDFRCLVREYVTTRAANETTAAAHGRRGGRVLYSLSKDGSVAT